MRSAHATGATPRSSVHPPSCRAPAGRLLVREVEALTKILVDPERPFVAIVGGAKVKDKLGVLQSIAERADHVLLGGAMCFTFLRALGHDVGASHVESELIDEARSLLDRYPHIETPRDVVALDPDGELGIGRPATGEIELFTGDLPVGWQGVDIGPGTRAVFADIIARAATVLWNGPMGVFEDPRFTGGTRAIADAVSSCPGFSVVGGGETAASLRQFGLEDRIDHISSGGGATLEFLEKGDLPGLAALRSSLAARRG